MIRPIRFTLALATLVLLVAASFVGGQTLRRYAGTPIEMRNRVTSLSAANIGGSDESSRGDQQDATSPDETFKEVLQHVQTDYVDKIDDDKKLGFGAVKAMLMSLDDPKTRFLDPAQRKQLIDQINGEFTGIGAILTVVKQKKGDPKSAIEQRRLAIVAPVPGGPAEKAGLRPGDIITEIDGHWVIAYDPRLDLERMLRDVGEDDPRYRKAVKDATDRFSNGMSLPRALEQLTGKASAHFVLTVERSGEAAPLKVTMTTATTSLEPVEFKSLSDHVGYLRVTQFNDRATGMFMKALNDASQQAIILDLRNNAGGPITARDGGAYGSALALLARLTPGGQIGTLLRKGDRQEPINIASSGTPRYRIVVLMNGGTANLAELVAAALKEKAGATLVGAHTCGDSVYQKLVELRDGAGMTVRSGKMLTARGMDFSSKGLQPDVAVESWSPRSSDPAVERAVSALAGA